MPAGSSSCDNEAVLQALVVKAGSQTSACMIAKPRFSGQILATLRESKGLRIRAGNGTHRFIGIWVVVVNDRVFVRSWSLKPGGWYRTFVAEPRGSIQIADHEIPIRAVRTRSEALKNAVDRAYLEEYSTAGAIKYARDLVRVKSRAATIELVPFSTSPRRSVTD